MQKMEKVIFVKRLNIANLLVKLFYGGIISFAL